MGTKILELDDVYLQNVLSDVLVLRKSAGSDDLLACKDSSQIAGCENINDTAEASQFPVGALCTPLLVSQGSQQSKAASPLSPGDPRLGSLLLQRWDALLARFRVSTAEVLTK